MLDAIQSSISLIDSANNCYDRAEYDKSLTLSKLCISKAEEQNDSDYLAEGLSCAMSSCQQMGILDSAIIYGKRLLEIDQAIGDKAFLASDYSNLAAIYLTDKRGEDAKVFIDKAIDLEQSIPSSPKLSIRYGLASEIYNLLGLYKEALAFAKKAYIIDWEKGDSLRAYRRLSQQGDVLFSINDTVGATQCYMQAIDGLELMHERHSLGITARQLGALYIKEEKYEKAIPLLLKALNINTETGEYKLQMQTLALLSDAYKKSNPEQALYYNKEYIRLKDSLSAEESNRQLNEFSVKYKTEEQRSHLIRQIVLLVIGILVLVMGLFFILFRLRKRVKHNIVLKQQIEMMQEDMDKQREEFLSIINQQDEKGTTDLQRQEAQDFLDSLNRVIFDSMTHHTMTVEKVAESMNMTVTNLRKSIMVYSGCTPKAYLMSVCMSYAKKLIDEYPNLTLAEIAFKCGFDEPNNFTRTFKREIGMTPKEYRKR